MKKRQKTYKCKLRGVKTTWYILEDESGLCAMSKTKDYERLKRVLSEEVNA